MADFGIMEVIALASLAAGATQGVVSYNQQKHALEDQNKTQAAAKKEQKLADEKAERQRLEAMGTAATATDYGNIWAVDSAKFKDSAQKLSAGTGSFNTEDEDENPFYTRGLL